MPSTNKRPAQYFRTAIGFVLVLVGIGLAAHAQVRSVKPDRSAPADTPPTPADLMHAWDEYISAYGEAVCEVRSEVLIGGSPETLAKDDYYDNRIVIGRTLAEGLATETVFFSVDAAQVTAREIRAANQHYAFSLTEDSRGSIELWELDAESAPEDRLAQFEGAIRARTWVDGVFATSVPGLNLQQVFQHKSFRLNRVMQTAEGNWQLAFECEVPGELQRVLCGPVQLRVQQSAYLLPVTLSARTKSPHCESRVLVEIQYSDSFGLPRMSSYRRLNDNLCDKERTAADMVCRIAWRRPTEEDRKTLYLSHYGLPEPKKPSRINWWIMLGGALLLAGAYRLISRRDQWART